MIPIVIYSRTSTDLQEKEHTIGSQLDALRIYAQDKGYQVVGELMPETYALLRTTVVRKKGAA